MSDARNTCEYWKRQDAVDAMYDAINQEEIRPSNMEINEAYDYAEAHPPCDDCERCAYEESLARTFYEPDPNF